MLRFKLSRALRRFLAECYGEVLSIEPVAERLRRATEIIGSFAGWFSCRRHDTVLEPEVVNGLEHLWLKSTEKSGNDSSSDRFVILYFHGGSYAVYSLRYYIDFCNILRTVIVSELDRSIKSVEMDVCIANYGKAPINKFPVPQQGALHIYEYLAEPHKISPSNIIVTGDSAAVSSRCRRCSVSVTPTRATSCRSQQRYCAQMWM